MPAVPPSGRCRIPTGQHACDKALVRIAKGADSMAALAFAGLASTHCSDGFGSAGAVTPPHCIEGTTDGSVGGDGDTADDGGGSPCAPPDSDGVVGGCYVFDLSIGDTGFSPIILQAQNDAEVTIHLTNRGTRPHGFEVACVPLSYPGCPTSTCFPPAGRIPSIRPGGSATVTFIVPYVEGIYDFRSPVGSDAVVAADGGLTGLWGQFVVQ